MACIAPAQLSRLYLDLLFNSCSNATGRIPHQPKQSGGTLSILRVDFCYIGRTLASWILVEWFALFNRPSASMGIFYSQCYFSKPVLSRFAFSVLSRFHNCWLILDTLVVHSSAAHLVG